MIQPTASVDFICSRFPAKNCSRAFRRWNSVVIDLLLPTRMYELSINPLYISWLFFLLITNTSGVICALSWFVRVCRGSSVSKNGSLYFSAKAFLMLVFVAVWLGKTPMNSTPFEANSSCNFLNSGVVLLQIGQVSERNTMTFKLSVWAKFSVEPRVSRRIERMYFIFRQPELKTHDAPLGLIPKIII